MKNKTEILCSETYLRGFLLFFCCSNFLHFAVAFQLSVFNTLECVFIDIIKIFCQNVFFFLEGECYVCKGHCVIQDREDSKDPFMV